MNRKMLIAKIVSRLIDEGTTDLNNYVNLIEQHKDMCKIVEQELDSYVIINGEVVDNG